MPDNLCAAVEGLPRYPLRLGSDIDKSFVVALDDVLALIPKNAVMVTKERLEKLRSENETELRTAREATRLSGNANLGIYDEGYHDGWEDALKAIMQEVL